jgi:hypothetical protein
MMKDKDDCQNDETVTAASASTATPVYVFQGDAREWANKSMLQLQSRHCSTKYSKSTASIATKNASTTTITKNATTPRNDDNSKLFWYTQNYHVLLVDPPRMGLGKEVIKLAINGSFEHLIYVSCGKKALIQDLTMLQDAFEVKDFLITDLFPRTDSVETILHLQRRRR